MRAANRIAAKAANRIAAGRRRTVPERGFRARPCGRAGEASRSGARGSSVWPRPRSCSGTPAAPWPTGTCPRLAASSAARSFPVIGELTADQLTLAEDYANREYARMQSDMDRAIRVDTFGRRAVERAEGGRRIPSPDGRSEISVSGPGLDDVPESLWTAYGQAVNRRDETAARRVLEMIRRTCNRSPPDE